ncbi:MAG: MFS transporter [Ignavibacteria bacterium RIFOXYB2_FULL_35_12]|nr:MAG: MFS transporter [Ignavibacteria bacterium GWA2_36_19]OGU52646.1 MAG: MFS transporter [Ignavibacteria bacterium GWC2_35_8]OGU56939.1 MAG: MFS transporter [Ignavibacteria bacterium GWF2_35_20]OGU79976.1 MAG: MFS transporter [Ignavibacteria bacterium RIFOXYA2_FULL_35_9]OGU85083.1 MAG: MFS transporter [Ignavibacteria bacterium RIFOXYA12_FULL_35_25]OGU89326.1 MAG: MFS transporter [Ignavibacteria bacterium RIFOXYC12_FULL_35_11]OGU97241.1 MAG: MFS transporter [Ignavibacteria bacterium RIFOXY
MPEVNINDWRVEDEIFWKKTGKKIAWRTLTITTFALILSFATWFMMSAIVVRLPQIGFKFGTMELFWLTAMPGLAGGTLRIIHTFLIPIFGTRNVITFSTVLKLIPCIGLGFAILNPQTPFWIFLLLSLSAGFGGGDFSSFMPSTSIFFPKRFQGTALGIQAGIGNFGVSLAQFVTPWVISFSLLGGSLGVSQVISFNQESKNVWLQNAAFWYVPLLIVVALLAWFYLKRIPIKASFKEQLDIFSNKHTWFCTIIYVMTFGSFSGFSASFPLLIKTVYGNFPDAPDPLTYAFLGPLIGSIMRVAAGPISDKTGGAILTHITGIGLFISVVIMVLAGLLTPESLEVFPYFVALMLFIFFLTGIGNASTFRQFPIIFSHSPRQAAGVLGWTAAVAAYGPFIFSILIGWLISSTGSANYFFIGSAFFYLIATFINWKYYTRKGAEKPS